MPDHEEGDHVEHRVITETVSGSSSKNMGITVVIIAILAIALIAWVVLQMR